MNIVPHVQLNRLTRRAHLKQEYESKWLQESRGKSSLVTMNVDTFSQVLRHCSMREIARLSMSGDNWIQRQLKTCPRKEYCFCLDMGNFDKRIEWPIFISQATFLVTLDLVVYYKYAYADHTPLFQMTIRDLQLLPSTLESFSFKNSNVSEIFTDFDDQPEVIAEDLYDLGKFDFGTQLPKLKHLTWINKAAPLTKSNLHSLPLTLTHLTCHHNQDWNCSDMPLYLEYLDIYDADCSSLVIPSDSKVRVNLRTLIIRLKDHYLEDSVVLVDNIINLPTSLTSLSILFCWFKVENAERHEVYDWCQYLPRNLECLELDSLGISANLLPRFSTLLPESPHYLANLSFLPRSLKRLVIDKPTCVLWDENTQYITQLPPFLTDLRMRVTAVDRFFIANLPRYLKRLHLVIHKTEESCFDFTKEDVLQHLPLWLKKQPWLDFHKTISPVNPRRRFGIILSNSIDC